MNTLQVNNLKNSINEKHNILNEGLKKSVNLAVDIGGLLCQVKNEYGHGNFMEWINNNCMFKHDTANNYMRLYNNADKLRNVRNLSEAYKTIKQIDYEKNKNMVRESHKVNMQNVNKKIKDQNKDEKWEKIKEDAFKDKPKKEYVSSLIDDDFIEGLKKQAEEEEKFKEKITKANKYQDTFFQAIDEYVFTLDNDIEKMEALQNIIKYCKRKMIIYHQESLVQA